MAATQYPPAFTKVLLFLVLAAACSPSSNIEVEAAAAANLSSSSSSSSSSRLQQNCGYWCVCKEGLSNALLQKTLDYACGAGVDCNPIKPNGACFNPNTVKAHCSYAVNSYFQKKGEVGGTCDFAGTAVVTGSDPSYPGCAYPASASAVATSSTPTNTPTSTNAIPHGNGTPTTAVNPSVSPLIGVGPGVNPSGIGMNDESRTAITVQYSSIWSVTIALTVFILALLQMS